MRIFWNFFRVYLECTIGRILMLSSFFIYVPCGFLVISPLRDALVICLMNLSPAFCEFLLSIRLVLCYRGRGPPLFGDYIGFMLFVPLFLWKQIVVTMIFHSIRFYFAYPIPAGSMSLHSYVPFIYIAFFQIWHAGHILITLVYIFCIGDLFILGKNL